MSIFPDTCVIYSAFILPNVARWKVDGTAPRTLSCQLENSRSAREQRLGVGMSESKNRKTGNPELCTPILKPRTPFPKTSRPYTSETLDSRRYMWTLKPQVLKSGLGASYRRAGEESYRGREAPCQEDARKILFWQGRYVLVGGWVGGGSWGWNGVSFSRACTRHNFKSVE